MAQFNQYLREGKYLSEKQYRKVQTVQAEKRNTTFFSALKKAEVLPEERIVSLACEFFEINRIGNAFTVKVDFPMTIKIMGDIFHAIEARMFVCRVDDVLTFVLNDPENEGMKSKATVALRETPAFALITSEEFDIINTYQLTPNSINHQATKITSGVTDKRGKALDDIGENESYTERLLAMLIDAALDRRASDLHLQPMGDGTAQVMLRVDGELYPYTTIKSDVLENLRNKLRTMAQVGGESAEKPVEGQISALHNGQRVDIRINIVKSTLGFDFNLRFIDVELKSLEELGLSKQNYDHYMHLLHMTKGLVILCGPTGSGKTSLLYAGFRKLLAENKAIFTIEDPVEIIMPGVTQIGVKKNVAGMSYSELFPSSLRQDPDIIGIGEVRTLDVALQTVQAADTGHLVFTTLHTNDAIGAISRLTNLGLDAYTIGDVLAAVVAQRLVRRVCTNCAEEYVLDKDHPWRKRYGLGDGEIKLKRGCGCEKCAGAGYRGRIAVNEFMIATPKLRSAIQKKCTRTEIEEILQDYGFRSYIEDAIDKAKAGIITFDEVDKLYMDILR